jgi:hypothetical protein
VLDTAIANVALRYISGGLAEPRIRGRDVISFANASLSGKEGTFGGHRRLLPGSFTGYAQDIARDVSTHRAFDVANADLPLSACIDGQSIAAGKLEFAEFPCLQNEIYHDRFVDRALQPQAQIKPVNPSLDDIFRVKVDAQFRQALATFEFKPSLNAV